MLSRRTLHHNKETDDDQEADQYDDAFVQTRAGTRPEKFFLGTDLCRKTTRTAGTRMDDSRPDYFAEDALQDRGMVFRISGRGSVLVTACLRDLSDMIQKSIEVYQSVLRAS